MSLRQFCIGSKTCDPRGHIWHSRMTMCLLESYLEWIKPKYFICHFPLPPPLVFFGFSPFFSVFGHNEQLKPCKSLWRHLSIETLEIPTRIGSFSSDNLKYRLEMPLEVAHLGTELCSSLWMKVTAQLSPLAKCCTSSDKNTRDYACVNVIYLISFDWYCLSFHCLLVIFIEKSWWKLFSHLVFSYPEQMVYYHNYYFHVSGNV